MKSIREKILCINCLNSGHLVKDCRSSTCKKCTGRHNTLLHRESENQSNENNELAAPVVTYCFDKASAIVARPSTCFEREDPSMNIFYVQKLTSRVILSTVRVYAYDSEGNLQICRALFNSGLQFNLVTAKFTKKLKLSCRSEDRPITGIGQTQTRATKKTDLRIKAAEGEFITTLECLVLRAITTQTSVKLGEANASSLWRDVS